MQHAITVGDLVKWCLIGGGIVAVLFILGAILSAIGSGFSR
jgi:hypothetical protein